VFNLEEYVKKTLIDLYDKKVYIGAKVRELALNYMIKGVITQDTVVAIDEYITNAETVVEEVVEEIPTETIEEIPAEDEVIENDRV